MELLLRACRQPQNAHKLWALDGAILAAYEELAHDFKLQAAVEEVKAEIAQETLANPNNRKAIDQLAAPLKEAIGILIARAPQPKKEPAPKKPARQPVSPGSDNGS